MTQVANDRRARISAKPGAKNLIYGLPEKNNILFPLHKTNGFLFPYTPSIFDTATVNYESYDPVHTNQPFMAFKSVAAKEIQITGTFTTMNQQEAEQNIANIHFLRTITKMYFGLGSTGESGSADGVNLRGTPPPILLFNAYGDALYHNVPVIVTTFNIEYPMDVDYVRVITRAAGAGTVLTGTRTIERSNSDANLNQGQGGEETFPEDIVTFQTDRAVAWLPTRFIISVQMTVQNTPDRLRRQFNLNDFRTGRLIKRGGWI